MTSTLASFLRTPGVEEFRKLGNRPVPVGYALLASLGIYSVFFVGRDLYNYYRLLPVDMRGTSSTRPIVYLFASLIRTWRWIWGMDGTSSVPIRKWVESSRDREPIYGRTYLDEAALPVRRAPRPMLLHQGVPQRQIPQMLDHELEQELKTMFKEFGISHSLRIGESVIEPNAIALFLPSTPPSNNGRLHPEFVIPITDRASAYEFAHVHGGESSLHLLLAPLDAALAIERGWAVRFSLAGCVGPWGHARGRVLAYAPRDEQEVKVIMSLVQAGFDYLTDVPKE
ncbi:hypothetical protein DACRYDRAFT_24277 [Dacryopinax primogenitus]|uniref:Luciferase domain-containing protein n=1 Tax=Dacryopinax primogenitus (strain DJM 731) TaxID=1858805 RepID=M5FPP4_DACPD|nr:uncharacterized protein DACRYDRAFT_24277 [Dacryopinax primogenitus]EJT98685.1 hypothetical protein DACRYDRAFT_24277 [Dacryopinax primogenitus]